MKAMRSLLKRLSFGLFMLGDRVRVHVLPKHYHTPIPDYRWLRRNRSLWAGRASVTGVHWDLDERSEEHTSELQSQSNLVCRLLLEKKKKRKDKCHITVTHISQ